MTYFEVFFFFLWIIVNSQEMNWTCEGQQKKDTAHHDLEISAWFHSILAQ